jgi:hypothetical protein
VAVFVAKDKSGAVIWKVQAEKYTRNDGLVPKQMK